VALPNIVSRYQSALLVSVQLIVCALILVWPLRGAASASELTQGNAQQIPLKEAGLWLNEHYPGPKSIMTANSIVVPYYGRGTMMSLPFADADLALKYIHNKKPRFIVLEGRLARLRPFTEDWITHGIPDQAATLIYDHGNSIEDKIAIFSFNPAL